MRKYLWIIPILFAVISPNAHAQTTYTYTGNKFTDFVGLPPQTCLPICSIDGSFTVPSPLPASTTTTATPPAFDFYISTAGSPSWTNLNTFVVDFLITTNSIGEITSWNIALNSLTPTANMDTQANIPQDQDVLFLDTSISINKDPGTWTVTTVTPEPSSLTLWLLGIFAVGIMTHRARTPKRPTPSLLSVP
jgi:hypothetical protein